MFLRFPFGNFGMLFRWLFVDFLHSYIHLMIVENYTMFDLLLKEMCTELKQKIFQEFSRYNISHELEEYFTGINDVRIVLS